MIKYYYLLSVSCCFDFNVIIMRLVLSTLYYVYIYVLFSYAKYLKSSFSYVFLMLFFLSIRKYVHVICMYVWIHEPFKHGQVQYIILNHIVMMSSSREKKYHPDWDSQEIYNIYIHTYIYIYFFESFLTTIIRLRFHRPNFDTRQNVLNLFYIWRY